MILWMKRPTCSRAMDGKELSYVGPEGRERIRQSLKIRYPGGKPKGSFTAHQITQPVIHVAPDGQRR
jgi:hypothetical protein